MAILIGGLGFAIPAQIVRTTHRLHSVRGDELVELLKSLNTATSVSARRSMS